MGPRETIVQFPSTINTVGYDASPAAEASMLGQARELTKF